jgi:hypothetical protein
MQAPKGVQLRALCRADGSIGRDPRPSDASHPPAWAALPRAFGAYRAGNRHNVAIGDCGMHTASPEWCQCRD